MSQCMFKLMRHFSIASLVSILAASLGLSMLNRKIGTGDIVRLGESGNGAPGWMQGWDLRVRHDLQAIA